MLTIAGIGPGNPRYLTVNVLEKIQTAEYIVAFPRISNTLKDIRKDIVEVKRVDDVLQHIEGRDEVLLLASGDPTFFGIVEFLKGKNVEIKEVIAGLSSFQYLMAKLERPWENAKFISLHGREDSLEKVRDSSLAVILTDKINTPSFISKRLNELNLKGLLHIGFDLSYESELIKSIKIGQDIEDISPLAVVVIEIEMD